jgi:glycosyltransferase involved in cell wall biosynthesis
MNILLSAFACDPSRGSEYSHGWNWAYELARSGHCVWVLTTPVGKASIEQFCASTPLPQMEVVYVGLPDVPPTFGPFRALVQCFLWQRRALPVAQELDAKVGFDVVHHVTWGSLHVGSQLWRLGKPFLFGPVGGGQVAPRGFSRYLRGGWPMEFVRSIVVSYFTGTLFAAKSTVAHAKIVLVVNHETRAWANRLGATRIEYVLDIGTPEVLLIEPSMKQRSDLKSLKILWVGRLLPRKGVLLALEALAQVDRSVCFTCTIVGDGKQGRYLPGWIERLGLADRVVWKGQIPWSEALAAYLDHDIFLFTSLRDTAGSQLVEAMARGNAIVTLDHQGARVVVPQSAGIKVSVTTPQETAAGLARAIERLAREPETLAAMGRNSILAAAENTWQRKISQAIDFYGQVIGEANSGSIDRKADSSGSPP